MLGRNKPFFILIAIVMFATLSISPVIGTHNEATEEYYRTECYTQCDLSNFASPYDAECREDCNTRLQEILSTHQEEVQVIEEKIIVEEEIKEETVMEEETIPSVEKVELTDIEAMKEEEKVPLSEVEKNLGCKTSGKNLKDCYIKDYDHFMITSNSNIVEKDGKIIITSTGNERVILTYNDGSKVAINKGEEFIPLKTSEIKARSKIGIIGKVKLFFNEIRSSENKFQTFIKWFSGKGLEGTEKANIGVRA